MNDEGVRASGVQQENQPASTNVREIIINRHNHVFSVANDAGAPVSRLDAGFILGHSRLVDDDASVDVEEHQLSGTENKITIELNLPSARGGLAYFEEWNFGAVRDALKLLDVVGELLADHLHRLFVDLLAFVRVVGRDEILVQVGRLEHKLLDHGFKGAALRFNHSINHSTRIGSKERKETIPLVGVAV